MGIDNVALKTFNSTGSQSVCRANEADSTQLIESQFLTKCTTEYINGSGVSYIPGKVIHYNSVTDLWIGHAHETFYLPSDCDAISEIIWTATPTADQGAGPTPLLGFPNINKVEVKVGNLTIQTLTQGDIISRNISEILPGPNTAGASTPYLLSSAGVQQSFSIPFTGRAKNVKNCFLQAGAVTNAVKLIVHYKTAPGATTDVKGQTGITVLSHQMTRTEKDFISKNIINRVVHTSQNCYDNIPSSDQLVIDLSHVNINVSHILIGRHQSITAADTTRVLKNAQLILGNDRTGSIPIHSISLVHNGELFSLNPFYNTYTGQPPASGVAEHLYMIKTADSAFSTAGIPFSRLNNKQLIIGLESTSGTDYPHITVTACGTQIQTTVGGTTSFSA